MDQRSRKLSNAKINIVGFASFTQGDPFATARQLLKDKKLFKFLSKQDALGLSAAGQAWSQAQIERIDANYSERTGIYLCVGILPFEDGPLHTLYENSKEGDHFSMKNFSNKAFPAMNPLLTFKCLPNMPLFHISNNFQITGRYFMTYPGIPEWFEVLKRAIDDLNEGVVEYAIVGAIADQQNFLVSHHLQRINHALAARAIDASSVLILSAGQKLTSFGKIEEVSVSYRPFDPLGQKELLIQSADDYQTDSFTGVAQASLFFTEALARTELKMPLRYCWRGDEWNYCALTVGPP